MIFISILILIVAIALPSFNKQLSPIFFTRISSIIFFYAGALSFNAFYVQSIGSGIGIYGGLFHVTIVSQLLEVFLLIIGSIILISWPLLGSKSTLLNFYNPMHSSSVKEPSGGNRSTRLITPPAACGEAGEGIQPGEQINFTSFPFHLFIPLRVVSEAPDYINNQKYKNQGVASGLNGASETEIINQFKYGTEYSLIVLFSTLGSSLLLSSSDLISMYLSIELQSFGLYVLATLNRDSESATSAGLKYFLLGGLSSCLILLGAGLIYTFTGLTQFESIYSLISVSDCNNINQGLILGFILIIVGLLFKIAAAPLHFWAPDVYDDSPTIVTIWLTIMPKISIIILLLELQTQIGGLNYLSLSSFQSGITSLDLLESITLINPNTITNNSFPFAPEWVPQAGGFEVINLVDGGNTIRLNVLTNLLLISSLLSLIIGTIVGLAQIRIKRLLAYSTISHIGFILLALGINTEQSIDSLIFYIIQYSLTNLNTFLIIIALGYTIRCTPTLGAKSKGEYIPRINAPPRYSAGAAPAAGAEPMNQMFPSSILFTPFIPLRVKDGRIRDSVLDIKFISDLKGQIYSNPLLSLSFTVCLFSMAGIPPLIGFFSKQFVLYSAIQNGYYFMSVMAILVSVISASYYLKIIRVLHSDKVDSAETNKNTPFQLKLDSANGMNQQFTFDKSDGIETGVVSIPRLRHLNKSEENENYYSTDKSLLTNFHSFLISSLTLTILLFVLKPSIILNITQLLSLSLYKF
jgi:NADH-ubiquinone oxidoreductase chain 2